MENRKAHWEKVYATLILMGILSLISVNSFSQQKTAYQCPMKCEGEKTYNTPGHCPVCGMSLISVHLKDKHPDKVESKSADNSSVKIIGAMMNVMHKGELFGTVSLDTITDKNHLYGLGPVENLVGEILIIDGKSYKSTVDSDTTMKVEQTYDIKAPFFCYANISKWTEYTLPDSIQVIKQLEYYLDKVTKSSPRPFMFKLTGTVEQAIIHVVNLRKGSKVSSPDEAHKEQKNYKLKNEQSEIMGFFSTEHKAIFTHHDTYLHMHLITIDRQKMGHLDKVLFKKETMKLYLPNKKT